MVSKVVCAEPRGLGGKAVQLVEGGRKRREETA